MIFCLLALASSVLSASEKPNIVFILADDLGYGDVNCFGGELSQIPTPNYDRMAAEGMKFTDAHPNVSHCIPTRMAIMTGRNPWRFAPPKESGPWGFLTPRFSTETFTLGDAMKQAGYQTTYIGKWHLGTLMPTTNDKVQNSDNVDFTKPLLVGPNDYGWDNTFILPGSLDMFPYVFVRNGVFQGPVNSQKGWSAFNRVGPAAGRFRGHESARYVLARSGNSFLASPAASKSPFFLFVALTAPHTPTSPSPPFEGKSGIGRYGDFVYETDHCIGRVLDALEKNGLDENTLVIATSDHGPGAYGGNIQKATHLQIRELEQFGHYSSGPFRGYKFSVYEGGLRVPFVARWPKAIPPGTVCDELVSLSDMMATSAELAGSKLPEDAAPDSISFAPLLRDPEATGTRKQMVLEATNAFAIRDGKWKLCLCPGSGCAGRYGNAPPRDEAWKAAIKAHGGKATDKELLAAPFLQLFDLESDPGESNNLAAGHPERVEQMVAILQGQLNRGRSTPGTKLNNDRPVNLLRYAPGFARKK